MGSESLQCTNDDNNNNNNNALLVSHAITSSPSEIKQKEKKRANVILLCGLPGSGKSTLASSLLNAWESATVENRQLCDFHLDENNNNVSNAEEDITATNNECKDLTAHNDPNKGYHLKWYNRVVFIDYDEIAQGISSSSPKHQELYHQQQNDDEHDMPPPSKPFIFTEKDLEAWRKSRSVATQAVEFELHRHFFGDKNNRDGKKEGDSDTTETATGGVVIRERKNEVHSDEKIQNNRSSGNNDNLLLLLDDNFHLRSMRKDIYKICKSFAGELSSLKATENNKNNQNNKDDDNEIYFGIIMVDAPLQICFERNKHRTGINCIPDDILINMSKSFEHPDSESIKFEQSSFVILNDDATTVSSTASEKELQKLKEQKEETIIRAIDRHVYNTTKRPISPPPPPFDEETERKRKNEERNITLASRAHRYDRLLRLQVGVSCRHLAKKSYARHVNDARRIVLTEIKNGTLYKDNHDGNNDDDAGENCDDDKKVLKEKYNIKVKSSSIHEDMKELTEGDTTDSIIIHDEDDAAVISLFIKLVLDDQDQSTDKNKTEKINDVANLLKCIQRCYEDFYQSYHSTEEL